MRAFFSQSSIWPFLFTSIVQQETGQTIIVEYEEMVDRCHDYVFELAAVIKYFEA
jgi:hypothetical protein